MAKATLDRARHTVPRYAHKILSVFICSISHLSSHAYIATIRKYMYMHIRTYTLYAMGSCSSFLKARRLLFLAYVGDNCWRKCFAFSFS